MFHVGRYTPPARPSRNHAQLPFLATSHASTRSARRPCTGRWGISRTKSQVHADGAGLPGTHQVTPSSEEGARWATAPQPAIPPDMVANELFCEEYFLGVRALILEKIRAAQEEGIRRRNGSYSTGSSSTSPATAGSSTGNISTSTGNAVSPSATVTISSQPTTPSKTHRRRSLLRRQPLHAGLHRLPVEKEAAPQQQQQRRRLSTS